MPIIIDKAGRRNFLTSVCIPERHYLAAKRHGLSLSVVLKNELETYFTDLERAAPGKSGTGGRD